MAIIAKKYRRVQFAGGQPAAEFDLTQAGKLVILCLILLMFSLCKTGATTTKLVSVQFLGSGNAPDGAGTIQLGPAVLDYGRGVWNQETIPYFVTGSASTINAAALVDAANAPSGLTLTVAAPANSVFGNHNNGTPTDANTAGLMSSDIEQFINTSANNDAWTFTVSGLSAFAGANFNLVVYAGAPYARLQTIKMTGGAAGGNTSSNLSTSSISRQISAGPGVAYNVFTGTLTGSNLVFIVDGGPAAFGKVTSFVNGFQLQLILSDPWVAAPPASQKVLVGRTASLSVTPLGTPPFRYHWQAGSVDGGTFTNLVDSGSISGATGKILTISNVTTNQAMDYRVVVANDTGCTTSSPAATLTVLPAHNTLVDVQFYATYPTTGSAQTGAAVLGSSGDIWTELTIPYYVRTTTPFNKVELTNTDGSINGITLTASCPDNPVYANNNPVGSDMDVAAGNLLSQTLNQYLVQGAGNDVWTITIGGLSPYTNSPFNLVIYAAAPSPQTQNITLTDGASGGNTGDTLTTSSLSRQLSAGPGTAYVKFSGILTGDNLTFTIGDPDAANNTVGAFFNGLQLQILDPMIIDQPASQNAFTGQSIQFSVGAVGSGTLKYQWQAGSANGPYTNLIDGDQITGSQSRVLKITNVTSNRAGDYQVIVSNGSSSVTSTPPATLTILPGRLIPLVNADFNADTISGPSAPTNQTTTPTGWTWNGAGIVGLFNPNYSYASPIPNVLPAGAVFTASPDGIVNPGISQILPTALNSNTTYTLSVQVGNRNSGIWGGYHIALETTNGTVVGDWTGENNNIAAPGTFATTSRSFTTGPNPPDLGQPLEIVLEQAAPAKNSYSDFASVLLATKPATPHAQGTPIDVYVCAGQSNAHGWQANPANLSRDNLHYVNAPDARALFAYQANLITQKNFYSQGSVGQLSAEGAGYAGNFRGFGPELSAGSDLAERFGRPLAIVKFASGGADLDTQFAKSANFLYPRLIAEVTNSLAQLIAQGYNPTLKGFFWLQGESDALLNPSTYATDIGRFVTDVRTDLNAPALQFVLTEINTNLPAFALSQAGVAQVNQAMVNLAKMDPNVKFVTTADINDGFADTVHYTADQIIKIGQRWAAVASLTQP